MDSFVMNVLRLHRSAFISLRMMHHTNNLVIFHFTVIYWNLSHQQLELLHYYGKKTFIFQHYDDGSRRYNIHNQALALQAFHPRLESDWKLLGLDSLHTEWFNSWLSFAFICIFTTQLKCDLSLSFSTFSSTDNSNTFTALHIYNAC